MENVHEWNPSLGDKVEAMYWGEFVLGRFVAYSPNDRGYVIVEIKDEDNENKIIYSRLVIKPREVVSKREAEKLLKDKYRIE